jgi:hypothetical protein
VLVLVDRNEAGDDSPPPGRSDGGWQRPARRLATFAAVLVALVVVAFVVQQPGGSRDDDADRPESSTSSSAAAVPSDPNTSDPADATPSDGNSELVDVRVESHGFADQVVFQLAEGSDDLAAAATVLPAAAPPSGECDPIPVTGAAFLAVQLPVTTTNDPRGLPDALLGPFSFDATDQITEVVVTCAFEDQVWVAVGLRTPDAVHRTQTLSDPPRVLVEVYPSS